MSLSNEGNEETTYYRFSEEEKVALVEQFRHLREVGAIKEPYVIRDHERDILATANDHIRQAVEILRDPTLESCSCHQ